MHNVIHIIVSSKWSSFFFSEIVHDINFSVRGASSFLIWSSKYSALYHHEDPSKSFQAFTLCSQLLFLFTILLLPKIFMEALHGGSSRILFILQLFFKFSLGVKIRQAIHKNKHGVQHMFCFEELKHCSSCILKCNSFFLIFWGGVMSLLTISLRDSSCQEWHNTTSNDKVGRIAL